MSKINILIDGNHFMHRIFSVLPQEEQLAQNNIQDIWFNNLKSHLGDFKGRVNRIVFAVDYGSWRNDFSEEVDYKGKRNEKKEERTEEEKEMYNLLFENYDKFQETLEDIGVIVSKIGGAEGDDIIYYWKDKFFKDGEHCVIYSGDSDLRQLVEYDGKTWSIKAEHNPHHNQLIAPEGFREEYLDEESIFDMQESGVKSAVQGLIQRLGNYKEVNPLHVALEKTISGDKGDGVPSMYYKKVKNGWHRLGAGTVRKVIAQYNKYYGEITDLLDDKFVSNVVKVIIKVGKIEDKSYSELKSKFKRNLALVHLNDTHYPSGILKALNDDYDDQHAQKFPGLKKLNAETQDNRSKLYDSEDIGSDYDPTDDFSMDNLI